MAADVRGAAGGYDLDPASGAAACADGEGVWLAGPGGTVRRALSSDSLAEALGGPLPGQRAGGFPGSRAIRSRACTGAEGC